MRGDSGDLEDRAPGLWDRRGVVRQAHHESWVRLVCWVLLGPGCGRRDDVGPGALGAGG